MIDWSLLRPVDIGGAFNTGMERGKAMVEEARLKSALEAYSMHPEDPNAQSALAAASPQFAMSLAQHRMQTQTDAAERARIGGILTTYDRDPEAGRRAALESGDIDLAKQLEGMSKDHREQMSGMYKAAAPFAYQALKLPYEQRRAYLNGVMPQLRASGWTEDMVSQFDPTDDALRGVVDANTTLEQLRERDSVTYKEVGPGARLVPFDSSGRPVDGTPAIDNNDDWEILPPEGGPTPRASGGFPQ